MQDAVRPTWSTFTEPHLLRPLYAQLVLTALSPVLAKTYTVSLERSTCFSHFINKYIGTHEKLRVEKPGLIVFFYLVQTLCSILSTAIYIKRTIAFRIQYSDYVIEVIVSSFFSIHYVIMRLQSRFQPSSFWTAAALVDVLTFVPILFGGSMQEDDWLSLTYMRSFRALQGYERLNKLTNLDEVSEMLPAVLLTALRFLSLVICMGGTIYVLEILGEIPGYASVTGIETDMGTLTFVQMTYWIITTISTVGYGDYSPTTMPSQCFVVIFIIYGIVFFSRETVYLAEIHNRIQRGKGKYLSFGQNDEHVVVVGSGISKLSSMIENFLQETLDPESGLSVPDVIFLSETDYDPALREFVKLSLPRCSSKVHFFRGSAMVHSDLQRVQLQSASMVFIVPDLDAKDAHAEDNYNILRAIEMRHHAPEAHLRLVLLEPEGQQRALHIGIRTETCFAARELKSRVLVHSARVQGFMTLLAGMMQVTTDFELKCYFDSARGSDRRWMEEYSWGLRWSTYGFIIAPRFSCQPFSEVVAEVYSASGGTVLIMGAQVAGRLTLNAGGEVVEGQVVVAIAHSAKECLPFAENDMDWRDAFHFNRRAAIRSRAHHTLRTQSNMDLDQMPAANATPALSRRTKRQQTGTIGRVDTDFHVPEMVKVAPPKEYEPESWELGALAGAQRHRSPKGTCTSESSLSMSTPSSVCRGSPTKPPILLLVVGKSTSTWQQVKVFLHILRESYLPIYQPITVVSHNEPPGMLLAQFQRHSVTFMTGEMMRMRNLTDIGLEEFQSVVILRGETEWNLAHGTLERSGVFNDHDSVVLSTMIDRMLAGCLPRPFTIYEFTSTKCVHILEHVLVEDEGRMMSPSGCSSPDNFGAAPQRTSSRKGFPNDRSGSLEFPKMRKLCQPLLKLGQHIAAAFNEPDADESAQEAEMIRNQLLLQKRFASGQAFTPDFFGGMLGHMFHFPATIELTEALTMPLRLHQSSFAWQVLCPTSWVGCHFGDLAEAWLKGMDPEVCGCGTALVLALYRRHEPDQISDASMGYNYTLPPWKTPLLATDAITFVAPKEFGKAMAERGILRGSEDHDVQHTEPAKWRASEPLELVSSPQARLQQAEVVEAVDEVVGSNGPVQVPGFPWGPSSQRPSKLGSMDNGHDVAQPAPPTMRVLANGNNSRHLPINGTGFEAVRSEDAHVDSDKLMGVKLSQGTNSRGGSRLSYVGRRGEDGSADPASRARAVSFETDASENNRI
eukprot:TRINITY_DN18250_c0_g1_i1.p1 TRINITY_DN18250_c0_g1~~TRINITY_DN18250_c0_g1_i1.p1  ORF type:complete len:1238 (+),score=258.29 TRINITY_DN18250_c0_g1_i1:134-3847(+)